MYVGTATGKKGLYGRIISQHLNPRYLQTDQRKWCPKKNSYQIEHHTVSNNKPAIDKSAFRKNIGRINCIAPGLHTVNFIKLEFFLQFLTLQSKKRTLQLEKTIIIEFSPEYNIQGNRKGRIMDFENVWNYISQQKSIDFLNNKMEKLKAEITKNDSIIFSCATDIRPPQSRKRFKKFFDLWFFDGCREHTHFRNDGKKKSKTATFRYLKHFFPFLEKNKHLF